MNVHHIEIGLQEELRYQALRLRPVDDINLTNEINKYDFLQEPYLERIAFYQQSQETTLQSLVNQNLLHSDTANMFARYLIGREDPNGVCLYEHQASAIRSINEGRNVVICTGTGSGKTESFLIPVINAIVEEREACRLQGVDYRPGVRAMLLYPMNALVNDQLKRIRKILKGSEVTYGIYTGELKQYDSNYVPFNVNQYDGQALIEKRHALQTSLENHLQNLQGNLIEGGCWTHSFTDDDVPVNEYTSRNQWRVGPADIVITNYAMLEQLLLNPQNNNIFSDTWKFIIVDEAHSYDGGLGTDIAWLLRRVKKATGANNVQCIATSATLIDDPDKTPEQKEDDIKREFAQELFSVPHNTFDVNLGSFYNEPLTRGNQDGADYYGIVSYDTKEQIEQLLNRDFQYIKIKKSCSFDLLSMTQWLKNQENLHNLLSRFAPVNEMAFSDAVSLSQLLSVIIPDYKLIIQPNAFFAVLGDLSRNQDLCLNTRKLIQQVSGIESVNELENVADVMHSFYENAPVYVECKYLLTIAQVAQSLFEMLPNFDASILYKQKVVWTEETAAVLSNILNDITNFGTWVSDIKGTITNIWNKVTGKTADVIENCVRDYLLQYPHVADLSDAFDRVRNMPELSKRSKLIKQVFGDVKDANTQFEALVSLLLLSSHPELARKPLMDLRYHQIVTGISEMAVSFHIQNGIVERKYHPNDARLVDDDSHILYTFGICYKCFHPYILVYCKEFNENVPAEVCRYDDGAEQTRLYAFSWNPGKTQQNAEHTHILHIESGKIEQSNRSVSLDNGELPLYCMHHAEIDEDSGVRTFIKTCQACGATSINTNAKYGNIAPYASGLDQMRTIVLHYLAKAADAQCGLGEMIAEGRKVLAFSDSRSSAARLAINFDTYIEQRLLESVVYNALLECDDSFNELGNFNPDVDDLETHPHMSALSMGQAATSKLNNFQNMNQFLSELQAIRYNHALQCSLPRLEQGLELKGASRLFDKAYNNPNDDVPTALNNKHSAASLLALSVLRSKNVRSLVQGGHVNVSFCYELGGIQRMLIQNRRNELVNQLQGEENFYACEREIAKRLFLDCALKCWQYDMQFGDFYSYDSESSLNGFGEYERMPLRDQNGNIQTTLAWETGDNFQNLAKKYGIAEANVQQFLVNFRTYLRLVGVLLADNNGGLNLNLDKMRFEANAENPPDTPIDQYFRIEEHTAQLAKEAGALNQRNFANGKVNILSCSTTFEMGVDLGDLNCVFLNNLPPKVSNYKQRAGRAGRRSGSASYVLTLIGDSAHDLYFKEHPHDLFFGRMSMPKFYMKNETFRAKHLRAIALAHFLKQYVANQQRRWRTCESFFAGRAAQPGHAAQPPMVNSLSDWLTQYRSTVQQLCCDIAGVNELPYSVADDLAHQIASNVQGIDAGYITYFEQNSEMLSGPRIHNNEYSCSVQNRYINKLAALGIENEGANAIIRQKKQDLLQELANNRVLPRYGFPCNTISLIPNRNDWYAKSVKLDRPKSSGIFEYAPKQVVVANKHCFKSRKPLFAPNHQVYYGAARNRTLYYCNHCAEYFSLSGNDDEVCCTMCGKKSRFAQKAAIEPDGFWSGMSESAKSAQYTQPVAKHCIYSGGSVEDLSIGVRNITVSPSATRALLFINPRPFAYSQNNQQEEEEKLLLMHELQTDMVLWDVSSVRQTMTIRPDWNEERLDNAWESVLQAVLSAVCKKLDISEKDVSGIVVKRPNKRYILLYDNSASGNGSLLPLIPTEQNQDSVKSIVEAILDKAREICESCPKCGTLSAEDQHKKTGTLQQSLLDAENYRPCCACYHCIMRYENQKYHGKLDVHDAAVILNAMLGKQPTGPKKAYKQIDDSELEDMKAGLLDDKNLPYSVLVGAEYKLLTLKRGKEQSARFNLGDDVIEVPYSCVFKA